MTSHPLSFCVPNR